MGSPISNWDASQSVAFTSPWVVESATPNVLENIQNQIKDTLSTAIQPEGSIDFKGVYTAEMTKPQLEVPVDGAGAASANGQSVGLSSLGFNNITGDVVLNKMAELVKGFTENISGSLSASVADTQANALAGAIEQTVNALTDAQLEKIDGSKTPEQVQALILFAIAHPEAPVSPEIQALAATIIASAEQQTGLSFDAASMQSLDLVLAGMQRGAFALALESLDLPAVDKNLLTLAASLPDLAKSLPPELKELLATVMEHVHTEVGLSYGIPEGFQFSDSAQIESMEGARFDQKVVGQLQDMLEDGKLTSAQFNELRSAYYLGQESSSPVLKELVQQFQAAGHLPADYRFPIDKEPYTAMLDGATFAAFKSNIADVQPPLSAEQQAQLMAALGSPAAQQNLPSDLKATFNAVKSMAIGEVATQYKLPGSWQPSAQGLSMAATNFVGDVAKTSLVGKELAARQDMLNTVKEMVGLSENLVKCMCGKQSPMRITIMNYMGVVSAALMGLQDQLYAASAADAHVIHGLNAINRDTTLTKLEKQRKQLEDVKSAHTKQQIQAVAGQYGICAALIAVMIICPFLVPIILGIMIGLVIGMIANAIRGGPGLSATRGPLDIACQGLGIPIKTLYIILSVLCPFAMAIAGFMDLMFTGGKGVIAPCLAAYGVPKAAIDKFLIALQVIFVVAMILFTIACYLFPPLAPLGAAMTAAIAKVFGAIASVITTAVSTIARGAKMVIDVVLSAIKGAGELLVEGSKNLGSLKSLGDVVARVGQAMIDFATKAQTLVDDILRKAAIKIKHVIAVGADKFEAGMGALGRGLERRLERIGNAFKELGNLIKAAGKSMLTDKQYQAVSAFLENVAAKFAVLQTGMNELQTAVAQSWDDALKRVGLDTTPEMRALQAEATLAEQNLTKTEDVLRACVGPEKAGTVLKSGDFAQITQIAQTNIGRMDELATLTAQAGSRPTAVQTARIAELNKEIALATAERVRLTRNLMQTEHISGNMAEQQILKAGLQRAQLTHAQEAVALMDQQITQMSSVFAQQVELLFQAFPQVVQAAWGIPNSILQGQIALIKAAFEAYAVETDAMLKILQAVINKVMENLQDMGQLIKKLIEMQDHMMKGMSDSMTRLSNA